VGGSGDELHPLRLTCPLGAECTVKGVALELTDKDVQISTQFQVTGTVDNVQYATAVCNNHPEVLLPRDYKPCPQAFTHTKIGVGTAAIVRCSVGQFVSDPIERVAGPDEDRLFSCSGELTTRPAEALKVVGTGTTKPDTVITGPGKLTVTGSTRKNGRVTVAARKNPAPPFETLKLSAKQAGPVQLPLRLTTAAKKTLKKKGKLRVALTLSFQATGAAKATVKKQTFTLTTPPKPTRARPRKK
jgi:hypothetical protein